MGQSQQLHILHISLKKNHNTFDMVEQVVIFYI